MIWESYGVGIAHRADAILAAGTTEMTEASDSASGLA
jgi:hypothetical protein